MKKEVSLELPEKISILQALYWIGYGKRPVDEAIFEVLNYDGIPRDHDSKNELIKLLRSGSVCAWGEYIEEFGYHDDGKYVQDSAFEFPDDGGTVISEIPMELWSYKDTNSTYSELNTKLQDRPLLYFDTYIKEEKFENREAKYRDVRIDTGQLQKFVETPETKKVGRPSKYDWAAVFEWLVEYNHINGMPNTKTELVNAVLEWCGSKWGDKIPSERAVHDKVGPLFDRLQK